MQVGDRFHQSQTEARAFRAARPVDPIKPIKDARDMLRRDPATAVSHHDLGAIRTDRECNDDLAAVRREAHGVIHQVAHRASEQNWVRVNLTFAFTPDDEAPFLGDRLIVSGDFFDRGAAVEKRALRLPLGCFRAGEKEQVVDDSRRAARTRPRSIRLPPDTRQANAAGPGPLPLRRECWPAACAIHARDLPKIARAA